MAAIDLTGEQDPGMELDLDVSLVAGREKRKRKSTTMTIDGQAVLKLNNYSLEDGEPTLSTWSTAANLVAPKGALTAFTFFCRDARYQVESMPFSQRAAQMGELWRQVRPCAS
jgi:hypothetical protein